jgi:hypothetical protein
MLSMGVQDSNGLPRCTELEFPCRRGNLSAVYAEKNVNRETLAFVFKWLSLLGQR